MTRLAGARRLLLVLAAASVGLTACSTKGTREWRPEDHDQEQPAPGAAAAPGSAGAESTVDAIVETTWESKCAKCHGMEGHGDGPSGPMVGAADLSDPKIQDGFTDDQLFSIITGGRGRMPSFGDLPPQVVRALIAKVRTFRGQ